MIGQLLFTPEIEGDVKLCVVDMSMLDNDLLSRFDNITHEKRRREKAAAAFAVGQLMGYDAVIGHAADGHPFVENHTGSLSISHADNILVAAYSADKVIGIDIEYPRAVLRRVAPKFLSEEELTVYREPADLLRAWTIKEAVYKAALVKGLSLFAIHLPLTWSEKKEAVVTIQNQSIVNRLYFARLGDAMITLAVRGDSIYRDRDCS